MMSDGMAGVDQPDKITEEDRLSVENKFLKMQLLQGQVQQLDKDKQLALLQMREIQRELEDQKRVLSQKYGIEIGPGTVTPDGIIVRSKA